MLRVSWRIRGTRITSLSGSAIPFRSRAHTRPVRGGIWVCEYPPEVLGSAFARLRRHHVVADLCELPGQGSIGKVKRDSRTHERAERTGSLSHRLGSNLQKVVWKGTEPPKKNGSFDLIRGAQFLDAARRLVGRRAVWKTELKLGRRLESHTHHAFGRSDCPGIAPARRGRTCSRQEREVDPEVYIAAIGGRSLDVKDMDHVAQSAAERAPGASKAVGAQRRIELGCESLHEFGGGYHSSIPIDEPATPILSRHALCDKWEGR